MYITIKVITNVITYANILICHFPSNNLFPAIVDDIIDGNLNSVDIAKNLVVFIGNNPPIYTSKSFGVPGIINNNAITVSIFCGSLNNLLFSNLFTFSFGKNSYIKSLPYFFTKKYIIAVTINTDTIKNIVPHIGPKHIPASNSTGSPGNIANTTCASSSPNNISIPVIPEFVIFSLNSACPSGVFICFMIGIIYIVAMTRIVIVIISAINFIAFALFIFSIYFPSFNLDCSFKYISFFFELQVLFFVFLCRLL